MVIIQDSLLSNIISKRTMLIGYSKMILLVKPMIYHAANHELIVKIFLSVLAVYFVQDTVVYLAFGNIYYCHSGTMLCVATLYNISIGIVNEI